MIPCTRVELVVEEALRQRVAEQLDALGVTGWTCIRRVLGSGGRGLRLDDDPTGASSNVLFIVAEDNPDRAARLLDALRPLLARTGGFCLVTEARRLADNPSTGSN